MTTKFEMIKEDSEATPIVAPIAHNTDEGVSNLIGNEEEYAYGENQEYVDGAEEGEFDDPENQTPGKKRKKSFQKFVYLTLEDRYNIILELQRDLAHRRSHAKIAQQYGVTRQCISKLAKNKDSILYNYLSGVKRDSKLMKPVPEQKDPDILAAMEEIAQVSAQPPEPEYPFNVDSLPTWEDVETQLTNIIHFLKYKNFAEEEMLLEHVLKRISSKLTGEPIDSIHHHVTQKKTRSHIGREVEGDTTNASFFEEDTTNQLSSEAVAIAANAALAVQQNEDDDSEAEGNPDLIAVVPVAATTESNVLKPKKGRPRKKTLTATDEGEEETVPESKE